MNPDPQTSLPRKTSQNTAQLPPPSHTYLPEFEREKISVEFVIPPSTAEHLRCSICLHLLYQPITLSNCCGNTFCADCLQNSWEKDPRCPICRKTLTRKNTLKISIVLADQIENLRVSCPSHKYDSQKNCQAEIKIKDLEKHYKSCPHMHFQCQCNEFIKRSAFFDREQKCKCLEVKCEYCSELYQERLITYHSDNCKISEIRCKYCGSPYTLESKKFHKETQCIFHCPYKDYGCVNHKFTQKEYKAHRKQKESWHHYQLLKSLNQTVATEFFSKKYELHEKVPDSRIFQLNMS